MSDADAQREGAERRADEHERRPADPAAGDDSGSGADQRMADLLRDSSTGAELRKRLQQDESGDADDLLSRLNALDFVQQVVGGAELPERIGGYRIKGLLGRGGMGTVYLGWQDDLEREVALKVLAPNYTADPTMRKRFRAEARATAALHHRSIVPIYDYGEAQGMMFFAMERVDGMSLDKHISSARRMQRAPLEPLDAARRFAGVADALGFAHRRRLLHRDVKPGNILVAGDGSLALTDFGLAKALDHASMNLTSKGGGFLGTLHYASPEQALGAELTPASDLYSLGVTMFEAVTGQLPLAGKTTEALLQSILHGTPKRLRDCAPKPPRDLEAVIDKLLAREPGDRYQDGEALARDLQRIADGEPVHIRRLPLHLRLWRRARKNPVLAGAFVAVFVLILATLGLIAVLSREKTEGRASRHQNRMVAIATDIGLESGSPWGPAPLLTVLTGVPVAQVSPSVNILSEFDTAEQEMPGDPVVARMRAAYVDDPLPNATGLLAAGRGFEAMQQFDEAIFAANVSRTGGDLETEIGLYRLYLGRGVAKLTATVARPYDARTDLALASYLRPGAAFPRALLDVLEVVQSADLVGGARRLAERLTGEDVASERVRTVGLLLWSAARERPHENCNLMEFPLDYARRRALHLVAADLLDQPPAPVVAAGEPTGLEARFARFGVDAIERLDTPSAARRLIDEMVGAALSSVHPESPMQAWRHLTQLLDDPGATGPLFDDEERVLSPVSQLQVWRQLVQLRPKRAVARLWLPRFVEFQRDHPGLPGLVEVAARMHLLAETDDATMWVERWTEVAMGDPKAQLARMELKLRAGKRDLAIDDAIVAVQNAIDPEAVVAEIVRSLDAAAQTATSSGAGELRGIIDQFRSLGGGLGRTGR